MRYELQLIKLMLSLTNTESLTMMSAKQYKNLLKINIKSFKPGKGLIKNYEYMCRNSGAEACRGC